MQIDYEITYPRCDLADERVENKPVLAVYYDGHFVRSEATGGVKLINLDEHDKARVYRGTLQATPKTLALPSTACIGFASYAQRRNEFGMACYTNAGTAHVTIDSLLKAREGQEFPLALVMETTRLQNPDEPVEKGQIVFRVKAIRGAAANRIIPLQQCILGAPIAQIDAMLEAFINRRVQQERAMRDTWPGIENVRAPMDISSAGIELTQRCFVPIEGFAFSEPLEVNAEYYQNAIGNVLVSECFFFETLTRFEKKERSMIRRNLTNPAQDFLALDRAHQAEIMAEACCYAAQSFDYISDTVEQSKRTDSKPYDISLRAPFEDFNNMGTTLSGDCEDGARLTQDIFNGLCRLGDAAVAPYPLVRAARELASHYTYFLTLGKLMLCVFVLCRIG